MTHTLAPSTTKTNEEVLKMLERRKSEEGFLFICLFVFFCFLFSFGGSAAKVEGGYGGTGK